MLVLTCAGASSFAAAQPASLTIAVVDEKGEPVPAAQIEVRRNGQAAASLLSGADGQAQVTLPAQENYSLSVSKKDYISAEVQLAGGSLQHVEVVLTHVELSQQKVDVQESAPTPVTEPAKTQSTLDTAQAENTPSRPATLSDALPLLPGVVRGSDGRLQIGGYDESHSAMLINSVNVTDPATGDFGLTVPIDSVETVSVAEMPYLAQYGRFTAGVVTAQTRRGGDKWHFDLNDPLPEFRIRSLHLEGLRSASPRVNFSGPILANRLYFLEGGEYVLQKDPVRTLWFPNNETISSAINSFTQLDYIVSPNQTLTASFHIAPHSLQYAGLNYFNPRPVTPDTSFHEFTGALLDRLAIGDGVLQSTFAKTRISAGIDPQSPGEMILNPLQNQGSYFARKARHATRWEWIEDWAPAALHFHGGHSLETGLVVSHSEEEGAFQASPVSVENAAGQLLERIQFTGGSPFAVGDTAPALYAQDHWVLTDHFALDAGLRLEAQTITHTVRAAPRAGFVWSPQEDGKTVVRGGAGIFYDAVPLNVYAFSFYPQEIITTYDPTGVVIDGPRHYFNVTDQLPTRGFRFVRRGSIRGNFAPYSIAGNVEVERTVNRLVLVRLKYLQSRAEDVITLEPEIVRNRGAFLLGSSGSAHTRQLEFTTRIGPKQSRQFFFSYVRQQARGDINAATSYIGNEPFPVVRQDLYASLPSEVPNRFLLWGTYALPWRFQVIPQVELRNGFPYQPTNALFQYLEPGNGPQYRFPRYFSLDMRISKDIPVLKKHAVRFSLSILNATDHNNPLEVHSNLADPQYGTFFGNYPRRFLLDFDFLY